MQFKHLLKATLLHPKITGARQKIYNRCIKIHTGYILRIFGSKVYTLHTTATHTYNGTFLIKSKFIMHIFGRCCSRLCIIGNMPWSLINMCYIIPIFKQLNLRVGKRPKILCFQRPFPVGSAKLRCNN